MPQPFNYLLNVPSPTENILGAVQAGQGILSTRAAQQKVALEAEQQKQLQSDIASLGPNPTSAGLSKLMVKYPSLSEQFKRAYDVLSTEQQNARINQASGVYAALDAGQNDVAQDLLAEQATAYRNSGQEREAKTLEDLAELVKRSPETAKTSTGLFLASAMGPDKFTETFTKLQSERREAALEPSKLTESQAKAREAATKADFAESEAVTELQKKGWNIYKIQEDAKIARENSRIAALNAQINREKNDLKRQELELKVEEMKRKRDQEVSGRAAEVESANRNIDNMLNTADRILKTPIGVVEDATGPIESRLPTIDADVADFESLLETFDAQAFIAQIPYIRGMGALSNAEGKKLAAALQNFNLKQSPERLLSNVRETQRLLLKARTNVARRFGVPESVPDTPEAETGAADIDALIKKYGG